MLGPAELKAATAIIQESLGAPNSHLSCWAAHFGVNSDARILGYGGFGVVAAGFRQLDGAAVAVKFQNVPLHMQAKELACLGTLAQNPHPNVIPFWEVFKCEMRQLMAAGSNVQPGVYLAETVALGWPLV